MRARPTRRAALGSLTLALAPALVVGRGGAPLAGETVVQRVPGITVTVETGDAHPGGLLVVRLRPVRPLGVTSVLLDGRRSQCFPQGGLWRGLVGIPLTATPGPARLGLEIRGRRGKRVITVGLTIAPHPYGRRPLSLAPDQIAAVSSIAALRDSRRVLAAIRTASETAYWQGPFVAPLTTPPRASFGLDEAGPEDWRTNERVDGIFGEQHRGLDYPTPPGVAVRAPAAGVVLLAGSLTIPGLTVVIDHGHGLLSLLGHLGRLDVVAGQLVQGGTPLGLTGATGLATEPHLHWAVYAGGVAIDPTILLHLAP